MLAKGTVSIAKVLSLDKQNTTKSRKRLAKNRAIESLSSENIAKSYNQQMATDRSKQTKDNKILAESIKMLKTGEKLKVKKTKYKRQQRHAKKTKQT